MSALANHAFAKMNGIGNEIVVVDLRDKPGALTAAEARAIAAPAGIPFDQLMVLQPPRLSGTEAFINIYNGYHPKTHHSIQQHPFYRTTDPTPW